MYNYYGGKYLFGFFLRFITLRYNKSCLVKVLIYTDGSTKYNKATVDTLLGYKVSVQFRGYSSSSSGKDITLTNGKNYLVILGSGFYAGFTEIWVLIHAQGQYRATCLTSQHSYMTISENVAHVSSYVNYYFLRLDES